MLCVCSQGKHEETGRPISAPPEGGEEEVGVEAGRLLLLGMLRCQRRPSRAAMHPDLDDHVEGVARPLLRGQQPEADTGGAAGMGDRRRLALGSDDLQLAPAHGAAGDAPQDLK